MGNEEDWEEDCVFILDIWVVFAIFFFIESNLWILLFLCISV